jgi:hypothetical protein
MFIKLHIMPYQDAPWRPVLFNLEHIECFRPIGDDLDAADYPAKAACGIVTADRTLPCRESIEWIEQRIADNGLLT